MDRIVTSMPLKELWNESGKIQAVRTRYLPRKELVEFLKEHPVEFVVANPGHKLRWIPKSECWEYWKNEFKPHIIESFDKIYLDEYPNGLGYGASEWQGEIQTPIILLEAYH